MMRRPLTALAAAVFGAAAFAACQASAPTTPPPSGNEAKVDAVFAKWSPATPGCAVAVGQGGKAVLSKAYGMADLEHAVPNRPDTIFEAGSVSKQFTAAAVLLLAREGKLSLDDPAKKYVPELNASAAGVTIRQMLTHTSGLRDWGSVEGIAGWPRTTRAYTHAHVVDILSRQSALNFPAGTRWSYSNSGYNLAAVIVSRVSGQSFADFTRDRIFKPLGMTHTSWRDDYTRVVKDRAVAYDEEKDGFHTDMPFENVHGNGGLLTTVGDLLIWNEHFAAPSTPEMKAWSEAQQEIGTFSDGQQHDYAFGLWINDYKGVKNVWHSGSTAGYRAHLNRFPDAHLSVAVLCNVSSGNATGRANAVSDIYLGDRLEPEPAPAAAYELKADEASVLAGVYRNTVTGTIQGVAADGATLKSQPNTALVAQSGTTFATAGHDTWRFDGKGGLTITDRFGRVDTYQKAPAATPDAAALRAYEGTYASADAETTLVAAVDGDHLVLKRRPADVISLEPVYADGFRAEGLGMIVFHRTAGRVTSFSVSQDRVWDLHFTRR